MAEELEARFRVRLEGKDELTKFFDKSKRDAQEFSKAIGGAFKDSAKEIAGFGYQTAKSLSQMATGNIGIANQAKQVLELRDSVSALAVMAGESESSLGGLRDQIHSTAQAANQFQTDVTAALAAFVEKTGDIETAKRNLADYGKVATATSAQIQDVALVGVELSDKLKIKDQSQSFAILAAQSKAGAIELKDLATKGPRIFAAAANAGATGEAGLRSAGALAQVYAKGFGGSGSAASVATAVENTFASIAKKQDKLEEAGITVRGRNQFDVLQDIIKKTGGDDSALRKIFTVQAMRGVSVLAREFKTTGGFGTFEKFRDINPDSGLIDRDFNARMNTGSARLKASQISIAASSDKNLGDKFDWLASKSHHLADAFDFATRHVGLTAAAFASLVLGKNMGTALLNTGLRGASFGVTPVHIASAAPGVGLGAGGASDAGGRFGKAAASAFTAIAAFGIAYEVGRYLDNRFDVSGKASKVAGVVAGQDVSRILDEGDASYAQKKKNLLAKNERDARVLYYEGKGMSHGDALNAADSIAKAIRDMTAQLGTPNIVVNIAGEDASAESDTGTRTPKIMVRRGEMKLVGKQKR